MFFFTLPLGIESLSACSQKEKEGKPSLCAPVSQADVDNFIKKIIQRLELEMNAKRPNGKAVLLSGPYKALSQYLKSGKANRPLFISYQKINLRKKQLLRKEAIPMAIKILLKKFFNQVAQKK